MNLQKICYINFSGEIGGSEKEIIKGEMIFKDGKLVKPVTIEAGWAMKNQLLSWLEGKETYDTKGQKLIRFYFNSQGILWYEKERGTEHPPSVFSGIASTKDGSNELEQLVPNNNMSFPKPSSLLNKIMKLSTTPNSIVLDFFAGSGTTAQSIIDNKREANDDVFYILIEMGEHFHNIMMPRIQRTIYSRDWKNGKPISRKGISQAYKYVQLESYEDTLNNLNLTRSEPAQAALLDDAAFGEDYLLHYMLDFESRGSLLNLERFDTPFDYQLQIAGSTVGETEATPVDLVETFNYLLGLHVQSIRKIEGAVIVRGTTRDEKQVLVIWRTVPEMDNDQLNDFFEAHLADESENITDIYVNGDNNLANIRSDDQHWTVHLTEKSFHRLMFEE